MGLFALRRTPMARRKTPRSACGTYLRTHPTTGCAHTCRLGSCQVTLHAHCWPAQAAARQTLAGLYSTHAWEAFHVGEGGGLESALSVPWQEPGRPTDLYEEYVCTSRPFKALVRPLHSSGPDTLVTINFRCEGWLFAAAGVPRMQAMHACRPASSR